MSRKFATFSNLTALTRRREALLWSLELLHGNWAMPSSIWCLKVRDRDYWGWPRQRRPATPRPRPRQSVRSIHVPSLKKKTLKLLLTELESGNNNFAYIKQLWDGAWLRDRRRLLEIRHQVYASMTKFKNDESDVILASILEQAMGGLETEGMEVTADDVMAQLHVYGLYKRDYKKVGDILTRYLHLLSRQSTIWAILKFGYKMDPQQVIQIMARLDGYPFLDSEVYKRERLIVKEAFERIPEGSTATLVEGVLTTMIDIYSRGGMLEHAERLFSQAKNAGSAQSTDLHKLMAGYLASDRLEKSIEVYDQNKDLHGVEHYDVLLACYAKIKDWDKLQKLFESLFDAGHGLPNIAHYTTVMEATSEIARTDIVEMLYDGLMSRNLKPTTQTLNALLFASLTFGDPKRVLGYFNTEFDKHGVEKNVASYSIAVSAYRQLKKFEPAFELVTKLHAESMQPERDVIRVLPILIGICAERRDSVSAISVLRWLERVNIEPSRYVFNAVLNCLVQSNQMSEALNVYEHIKEASMGIDTVTVLLNGYARQGFESGVKMLCKDVEEYGLQPDPKYYSALMRFYSKTKQDQKVRQLMEEMENNGVVLSPHHHTLFMSSLMRRHNYEAAIIAFNNTPFKHQTFSPTYKMHAMYLRALTMSSDPENHIKAHTILLNFLNTESLIDLTSDFLTRDKVHPLMLRAVVLMLLRERKADAASQLMDAYYEATPQAVNSFIVLGLDISVRRIRSEWTMVDAVWNRIVQCVEKGMVPKYTEDIPELEYNPNDLEHISPPRYREALSRAINTKLLQLQATSQVKLVEPLLEKLGRLKIELTNSNLNKLALVLFSDSKFITKSFSLIENRLMDGYIRRVYKSTLQHRQHEHSQVRQPRYYCETNTLSHISRKIGQAIDHISKEENCDAPDALKILQRRYPKLLKGVERASDRYARLETSLHFNKH